MTQQLQVTLQPSGKRVFVLEGTTLLEAAARAGIMIDTPCGGGGTCGKCRVQVSQGAEDPNSAETNLFSSEELGQGWRLACQSRIRSEAVVSIPVSSLFAADQQIVTTSLETSAGEILPSVRKTFVELAPPSLEDDAADLYRLEKQIGEIRADLEILRTLPGLLRKDEFKCTAVRSDRHLLAIEAGDTTDECFGVAVDLGTTTLVATLLDLARGCEVATESMINPQVRFGDDVVSRIQHAGDLDGRAQQRKAVLQAINELISKLSTSAGISPQRIYDIALAGNTTMEHLLCGLDVAQLGQVPFVPAFARGLRLSAGQMEIGIHSRASAYVFPVIGGFVGGDTVACMLATQIHADPEPTLMVDVGTNGEIVVQHEGKLLAASTAAGPAFEGARISSGMRAACGAIEKVILDGDLRMGVIGGCEPAGICGSGLIDLMACLLEAGLVTAEGRIRRGDELSDLPDGLASRVVDGPDGQGAIRLFAKSDKNPELLLTQRDIREVQLGTGAIRAGVAILLKNAGIQPEQLGRVLIAGGFGSFIRRSNAQRIGLLPGQIPHQRIHYVGNASLRGAQWALLSTQARQQGEDLARKTTHMELSQDMNFQMEFAEAMIFPDA